MLHHFIPIEVDLKIKEPGGGMTDFRFLCLQIIFRLLLSEILHDIGRRLEEYHKILDEL